MADVPAVRIITAAPELTKRGVVFSIGRSIASTDVATAATRASTRLITHLFNVIPRLHHHDPSIIGLLGASPHLSSLSAPAPAAFAFTHSLVPINTSPPLLPTQRTHPAIHSTIFSSAPSAGMSASTSAVSTSEAFDGPSVSPLSTLTYRAPGESHGTAYQ